MDGMYLNSWADSKGLRHVKGLYRLMVPQIRSWMENSWWWVSRIVEPGKPSILSSNHYTYFCLSRGPTSNPLTWLIGLESW